MALKELIVLPTKSSPEIILKPNGTIKIRGRSMNRNATEFFKQIEDWVDKYICDPADLTHVEIYLEYINEIHFKTFISLIKKIESIRLQNKKYIINWYYDEDDEDILDKGEYISCVLDIPFNFLKIQSPLISKCNTLN